MLMYLDLLLNRLGNLVLIEILELQFECSVILIQEYL